MAKATAKSTSKRPPKPQWFKRLNKLAKQPRFRRFYVLSSIVVLLATTVLWAILGARTQQANADQLANAYLFEDEPTFKGAQLPTQHSFLLKWPLWLLIKLAGYSSFSFIAATVCVVLITVGVLSYIMYRIERRPLVYATLNLALASVLLMVPTQPYAGALLPVSMAMVTTRNLEYLIYIAVLVLLLRPGRLREYGTMLALALLALLIASDHLFLTLSLGASLLVLAAGWLWKYAAWKVQGARQLGLTVLAAILSAGLLQLLRSVNLLQVAGANGAAPYAITTAPKDIILGIWYGLTGLLTTIGANPVHDAVQLNQIPNRLFHNVLQFGLLSYVVNFGLLVAAGIGFYAMFTKVWRRKTTKRAPPLAHSLSVAMAATTITALVLFIGSQHYYAVDARYVGVAPFALFIVLATWSRQRKWQAPYVVLCGALFGVSCLFASAHAVLAYQSAHEAEQPLLVRNQKVIQALQNHHVDALVGDYWRTLPIKQESNGAVPILPLENCTTTRTVLTSNHWTIDLETHRFAYLLSFDKGQTDYPACSLEQVAATYGRPSASTLIAGTLSNPKEMLLFYDNGTNETTVGDSEGTILPVELASLGNLACEDPTVMNVVAHQDDDLLFMNPDLLQSLGEGRCVRTVYVTAGDSGGVQSYWLAREQGSEAAYARMLQAKDEWVQYVVRLGTGQYVTLATLRSNPKVSLVFMRLPDGNLDGKGFAHTKHQSLARLSNGEIKYETSVDGQSRYNSATLQATLHELMQAFQPQEVRTQSGLFGTMFTDHSDHRATGALATQAFARYKNDNEASTIAYYMGYSIREQEPNVSGNELAVKQAAFLAYAKHDPSVCGTSEQCEQTPTYGSYLLRQYRVDQ